jgi:hypothetical protein
MVHFFLHPLLSDCHGELGGYGGGLDVIFEQDDGARTHPVDVLVPRGKL